jgi:outer membrane receptor protein involved in Fe transport
MKRFARVERETRNRLRRIEPPRPRDPRQPPERHHRFPVALFLVCSIATHSLALDGVVLSPKGAPCPGAWVQILGRPGVTVTDADGRFHFDGDPTPPFDVLISRPDGVALRPIHVAALPTGLLELWIAPLLAEEVTVISGSAPDIELPPAAAFTLSGRADLDQRAPVQLYEVLENIPAAGRVGDGLAAVPSLRGLAQSRTLILLDEGRVSAERRAGPSATFLDPATIDEVEVVRGPGSVAYGSDAFGGTIRIRTRIPGPGEPLGVRYYLAAADATGERSGGVEVSATALGGGLVAGFSRRHFDDYASPSGVVPLSGGEGRSARLGYQHELAGGALRILWRTDIARDVGKPAIDSAVTRTLYPEETSQRLSIQYDRGPTAGFSRVSLAATWDRYRLLTDRDVVPTPTKPRQVTRADVEADDWGLRMEAERALGSTRLAVGFDASGRRGLSAVNDTISFSLDRPCCATGQSREVSIADASRNDLGVFAGAFTALKGVSLSAGVRGDRVTSENSGGYFGDQDRSSSALSGFAAATVPFGGGFEASLQVARGFREPLLSDRFYRGVTGRGYITGNPDLEAETSRQLDVALRFARGRAQLALYGYLYRIDALIERYRSGDDYYFRNRGQAEVAGTELEAAFNLGARLVVQAGLQLVRGEVRDDSTPTDDVPPRGGFLVLRQELVSSWSWFARLAAYRRDERPGPSERVVPGYAVVDGGVGYRVSPAFEVWLLARNLLDREYPSSADAKSVAAPGRTLLLSLRGMI